MSVQGKFVWHDLMSPDVPASARFYGELFGWKVEKEPNGPYHLIHLGDKQDHFGGMLPLDASMQAPPHWAPYVAVTDLDGAAAAVPKAGGVVHMPKTSIGDTGWFAVVGDPQGASFMLFQYGGKTKPEPESDTPPPAGRFCWDELWTSDTDAAVKFYAAVAGFGNERMEMPEFGYYTLFLRDAKDAQGKRRQAGGMMKLMPGMPPHPFWLAYVAVADTDATADKAKRLGATITQPPANIPNVGRFATLIDPQGAALAILGPNT